MINYDKNLRGYYAPIYLGEPLYELFNMGNFGSIDPIDEIDQVRKRHQPQNRRQKPPAAQGIHHPG